MASMSFNVALQHRQLETKAAASQPMKRELMNNPSSKPLEGRLWGKQGSQGSGPILGAILPTLDSKYPVLKFAEAPKERSPIFSGGKAQQLA